MEREEFCCDTLYKECLDENIINDSESFRIYGKPYFVDDGDDHYDDITPEINILFCPFCGHKLNKKRIRFRAGLD